VQVSGVLTVVEATQRLDRLVDPLRARVQALLPRRLADALHGVWLGHPLHPMLVQAPLGCWLSAGVLDLAGPGAAPAANLLIGSGLAAAAPAALAGWADWAELHPQQARVGLLHAGVNIAGIALYAASLAQRLRGRGAAGRALGFAGLGAVGVGGFVGGHLSYRQAAGVNHAEAVPHLVPTGWHRVTATADLADERPVRRQLGEVPLVLLRRGGVIYALADQCSHLSGPLHEGELTDHDGEPCLSCPWHASVFRLRDGAVVHGPATAPQPVLRTRVVDGWVEVCLEGAG
jgi:nitrite reductase/ring-hydroxylating ferredoxin subunit/uncharacterized membrane protein